MSEKCKICDKQASDKFKPFCSKRCADIDLGRWLKGSYAIKGKDGEAGTIPANNTNNVIPKV